MKVVLYGPKNPETIRFFMHLNTHEARAGLSKTELMGFLHSDPALKGKEFHGYPIFGGFDAVAALGGRGRPLCLPGHRQQRSQRYRTARGIVGAAAASSRASCIPTAICSWRASGPAPTSRRRWPSRPNVHFGNNCSVHMGCMIVA